MHCLAFLMKLFADLLVNRYIEGERIDRRPKDFAKNTRRRYICL